MTLTTTLLRRHLVALGAAGRPVCAHAALRAIGPVEGGADAVIDAFLAEGCTLMMPTFTYFLDAPPLPGVAIPERNGFETGEPGDWAPDPRRWSTASTDVSGSMGALPRALLRRAGRVRGDHPLNSFAALGPRAAELVGGQNPCDLYAPFDRLLGMDGVLVQLGTDYTSLTFLHHAEVHAGRRLFVRWAMGADERCTGVRVGFCSAGFNAFAPHLDRLARDVPAGRSRIRVFDAREVLDAAVAALRRNPRLTRCAMPDCPRCEDAIAGGPFYREAAHAPRPAPDVHALDPAGD